MLYYTILFYLKPLSQAFMIAVIKYNVLYSYLFVFTACVNNVSLKPQESFVLESKNNVQDTLCQWNIDVVSNIFWLKISTNHNDCTDSILVIANRTLKCKQSKYLSWIEQTEKIRISYRTDTAIDGIGISFIVSIVGRYG